MPNVDGILEGVSQIVTANTKETLYFSVLDLKYAYSQLKLTAETAKQCNFNIIGGHARETYWFLSGFYGLADCDSRVPKGNGSNLKPFKKYFAFQMIF